jgi:hypothetical protein
MGGTSVARGAPALGIALAFLALALVWTLAGSGRTVANRERVEESARQISPGPRTLAGETAIETASPDREASPGTVRAAVEALEAAAILGTVQDTDGRPVSGARVILFDGPLFGPRPDRRPRAAGECLTGADGRYRFTIPASSDRKGVRVSARGFATRARNQLADVDVPIELHAGATLVGRLVGEGAAQARVLRASEGADAEQPWARVDDGQGAFTVDSLPVDEAVEFIVAPAGALPFTVTFRLPEPGVHERQVDLGGSETLVGRVVDSLDGRGVPGATLWDQELLATSDERGTFELVLRGPLAATARAGQRIPLYLEVRAQGFLTTRGISTLSPQGGTLRLVRAGRVEGVVETAQGARAVGVEVEWVEPLEMMGAQEWLTLPRPPRTTTDAEGRFVLEGIPWGVDPSAIEVRAASWRFRAVDVAPDEAWTPRELHLRAPGGRRASVRVLWSGMTPNLDDLREHLQGVEQERWPAPRVTVRALDAAGGELARATTDARGRAQLDDLPAGELSLEVLDHPDSRKLLADETLGEILFHVEPPMLSLKVRLRQASGALLPPDAFVFVAGAPGDPRGFALRSYGPVPSPDGEMEILWTAFESAPRLCVRHAGIELTRPAEPGFLDWTLPLLVPCRIEGLENLDGRQPVSWSGPGPGLGGRRILLVQPGVDAMELALPAGRLELQVGSRRLSVLVEPRPDGAPMVLRLSR